MANEVLLNCYQIDQRFLPRDQSQRIGFPTQGLLIGDCSGSPTRSLPSGYNVYSFTQYGGHTYYFGETLAQLATAIG